MIEIDLQKLNFNRYVEKPKQDKPFNAKKILGLVVFIVAVLWAQGWVASLDYFSETKIRMLMYVGLMAPILEEIVFRWNLHKKLLRPYQGIVVSTVISSSVFSLAHFLFEGGLNALDFSIWFAYGSVFALTLEKTRKLWLSIIFHVLNNSLIYVSLILGDFNGPLWAQGLLTLRVLLIVGAISWLMAGRNNFLKLFDPTSSIDQKVRNLYIWLDDHMKRFVPKKNKLIPSSIQESKANQTRAGPVRVSDRITAVFLIFFLTPLFLLVAIIVKIESPKEPILYRDQRVFGFDSNGQAIIQQQVKFRTMRSLKNGQQDLGFVAPGNNRTTSVGKFFRLVRIDELPQIWQVVIGKMNLIGFRPRSLSVINQEDQNTFEIWKGMIVQHQYRAGVFPTNVFLRSHEYNFARFNYNDPQDIKADIRAFQEFNNTSSWMIFLGFLKQILYLILRRLKN